MSMTPGQVRRINLARFITERYDGNKGQFADAVRTKRTQVYRYFAKSVKGQEPGEDFARRVEDAHNLPRGYFDRDPDGQSADAWQLLAERFRSSPPDVQMLIQLALDDPKAPISDTVRPSLKAMLDIVRSQIRIHLPP